MNSLARREAPIGSDPDDTSRSHDPTRDDPCGDDPAHDTDPVGADQFQGGLGKGPKVLGIRHNFSWRIL